MRRENRFNIFAGGIEGFESETKERDILKLSHGTAVILLLGEFRLLKRFLPERSIDGVFTRSSVRGVSLFPVLFPQEPLRPRCIEIADG